ncbi:transferase hexapeptide repeat containing protein [Actinobacteria bacterium OV450]|nr:transferase hexapeptide repeat containing protein [Actinobacteria bacterium OV450]
MKITARWVHPARYGDPVPKNQNTFSSLPAVTVLASLRRRLASRAVHAGWRWMQQAGAVTAQTPGRLRFGAIGHGTRLAFPQGTVFGEPWIRLGEHCIIAEQVTLTAGMMPGLDLGSEPVLVLGNGVVLGRDTHVIADTRITIGNDTFCGPGVYITSTNHSYDDPHEPVGKQWPRSAPVEIGPGCWLGTGAVILPGARLGRNVVVAAGAVVRGEVPDHAVVAGAPARIVRRWQPETGWQPPLRTPAPVPIPEGVTPEQLRAVAQLAEAEQRAADPAAEPA